MNAIKTSKNISTVTAYFLACGYVYELVINAKEISISEWGKGQYNVSCYNLELKENVCDTLIFDTLSEAKKHFQDIKKLLNTKTI